MSEAIIDVGVKKSFGSWALNANFRSDSRRLALWGPSGAGKSLTLKCIAGLIRPDAGRIAIDGHVLFDSSRRLNISPQHRRVGMVFQDYALFPHLTVSQNLGFAIGDKRTKDDRVAEMADGLGIRQLMTRYPNELSGGQRQRVALGRSLLAQPSILLLDEPFSSLDFAIREKLRNELSALLADIRIPVVIVSHDPGDISSLADEVIVIDRGVCSRQNSSSVSGNKEAASA